MHLFRDSARPRLGMLLFQVLFIPILLVTALGISPAQNTLAREEEPQPSLPVVGPAAPLSAPAASVALVMPGDVLLRDDVTFSVTFSNTGADPGFGPFIDLVIPVTAGLDTSSMTITSGGSTITPVITPFTGTGPFIAGHPYARDNTGNLISVDAATIDPAIVAGDELVTILLPFGSFSPGQPTITVDVTIGMLAPPAQVGTPISVWARGGYRYGATSLDDWCCGDTAQTTLSPWDEDTVTPQLWTMTKTYSGPEDEAATGPNFRTFYPLQYTLTVDVAAGETVHNVHLLDTLPDTMQFFSVVSSTPPFSSATLPSTSTPGGTLDVLYNSITGTSSAADIELIFDFYIPLTDGGAYPVDAILDPDTADDLLSCNDASLAGNWPLSGSLPPVTSDTTACDHELEIQSIAIQKGAVVDGGGILRADEIIRNTLSFQVSDFFAFENISIRDIVSDGQHFYTAPGFEPQMSIDGNSFTLAAQDMDPGNYDVTCDYSGTQDPNCDVDDGAAYTGETWIIFEVSQEMTDRSASTLGRMVGGCVDPAGGTTTPDCGTYNNGATSGQIVFYTIALHNFTDDFPSGDTSLDQGDLLTNVGEYIRGDVLDTDTLIPASPTPQQEEDDTSASLSVPLGELSKSIYAVTAADGTVTINPPDPVNIAPGDTVTYRITYEMPVSNEENLHFIDYLPLPVFIVGDPDSDDYPAHSDGPAWTFDPTVSAAVPAAGVVKFGPNDTFYDYMSTGDGVTGVTTGNAQHPAAIITPVVTSSGGSNSVRIAYPDYSDTRLTPTTVDLLLSVTVNNEPFADELLLTNQAYAYEGSTNAGTSEATAIKQVTLYEPLLITTKSAIWAGRYNTSTTNWDVQPDATFSSAFPVTILDPSNTVRWSGTITDGTSVDANVSRVDAGDVVTFMILIDNAGHSNSGAFDLIIKDSLPSIFSVPTAPTGLNLHIFRGDGQGVDYGSGVEEILYTGQGGAPAGFTGLPGDAGDIFGNGIRLTDPADVLGDQPVCQAHNVASGQDIIIITYDLQINYGATAGSYTNTANNTNYAGENDGENHIPQDGFSPIWEERVMDDAVTTIDAAPVKYLTATSEADTLGSNVTIGEIIRYRIVSTVPEGSSPNFQMRDQLPTGLIFLDDGTSTAAFVSDNGITSAAVGTLPVPAVVNGVCTVNLTGSTADAATPASASLCVLADGNVGSNNSTAADADSYNSGTDVYFKFGGLTNSDDDLDSEYVVLEFNALADNTLAGGVAANVAGDVLNNSAQAFINGSASGSQSGTIAATVVEPDITFAKTIVSTPSPLDAGGVVHYRITYSNAVGATVSTAWDINITDALASQLLLPSTGAPDLVITTGGTVGTITNNSTTSNIDILIASVAPGGSVTVDFYPVIQTTITPGQIVGNIGDSIWTSLPGTNGTTGNGTGSDTPGVSGTTNGERNGTGTNPPNDYNATDTESFTADLITVFTKQITATSEAATTGTNVAIGEEITYSILLAFPEGTTTADTVVDDLPTGLEVVTGTAEIITMAAASGGLLTDDFNGTIGTQPITETAGDGGSVQFDFTNVVVAGDNDAANNVILLRFRARVTDMAGNQAGTVISNSATNQIGAAAPTSTNTVTATVVEPAITFGKSIISLPVPLDAGGVVQYRITYVNGTGATVSTAQDVHITDNLPAQLSLNLPITITLGGGATGSTDSSAGNNVDVIIASVPAGGTVTIDYTATIQGTVTPGEIITNTSNSTWTSLTGAVTGERDGSDGPAGSPDDYAATSSQNFTIDSTGIIKQITLTSASHTTGNNVVIGEVITYDVVLAFAEGTTATDTVVDDLVSGLEVVTGSPQVITSAAASGGLLTQDFNGTIGSQNITEVAGDGGSVTFDFGNVVVAADNNAANNSIVLRLQARVTNVIGNQDAVTLSNEVTNQVDAGAPVTSNPVTVTVIEPVLTIVKTVSDPTPAVGQVLTFTLTLSHTVGTTDAFDVLLTDDIPAELDLNETSVAIATSGPPSSVVNASITSSTDPITVTADSMRLGGVITITYEATVIGPYGAAFNNTADAAWTSLFGVITGERTGAGGVDDYAVNAQANILADRALAKNLIATNVNSTTTPEVTIGEIVTYEIVLTIPAGSTDTAIITDQLDSGLAFVSCSQMLASSASLTSTTVDFTNAANCNHGTSAVANNPVISPSGGATGGNTITFDLGDITNASAAAETITLTYDVVVLDIAANVQNAGVLLDNDVDWTWATGTLSVTASPSLEIVEPDMEIEKTVDPTLAALGSTVTFTIEIGHTPLSQTTAYDVIVTDNLPASLVLDELSVTAVTTGGVTGQTITTTPTSLIVSWDVFPLGGTGTITFQATFVGPSPAINSASVEWSSLEIDPILGVSVQQSAYNAFSTERRYDPLDLTGVNNYVVSSIARLGTPPRLPRTGFAPGRVTQLPEQPQDQAYMAMGELWLEIPKLGVSTDIVGVPFGKENWDLTWLADNAGYLDGTAYPTYHGNSGITAHAYLADGTPGPFVDLDELGYGDQIIVHIGGQQYIYEVREEKQVRPDAVSSVLKHEELAWLTLITCKNYNETTDDYVYRVVVRAVLVDVIPE